MSEFRKGERSLAPASAAQAWRRRIGVSLLLGGALAFSAVELVSAIDHADDPIPAGCDVTVPKDGTVWGIASQIAEHVGQPVDQVDFEIGRANPGVSLGQVEAWQQIGIPTEYCQIVDQYDIGQ
jgi:hypothetical protein